jgi:hypothetical protein
VRFFLAAGPPQHLPRNIATVGALLMAAAQALGPPLKATVDPRQPVKENRRRLNRLLTICA